MGKIKESRKYYILSLVLLMVFSSLTITPHRAQADVAIVNNLATIAEDTLNPAGQNPSLLYANGIGITDVDNTNGQWQYYNNAVSLWYSLNQPNTVHILGSNVPIRFIPKKDWNGTVQIKYHDWTSGSPNSTSFQLNADYSAAASQFDPVEKIGQITVTPVNDAPYITETNGGYYLGFDGTGYVTYPDLGIYSNSLTFEGWINASSAPTWARIFDTSYGSDNFNLHLAFSGTTGRMALEALPQKGVRTADYIVTTTEAFPLNQWVHVAAVYNHSEKKAYIYWNGILKASGYMNLTNMANGSAHNSNTARPNNFLGKSTWSQDASFQGGMRDVRFWNKARSQDEIVSLINSDLTGTEANLVASYKLSDSNDGAIAKDTASVKNGTIVNGKWQPSQGFNSNVVTPAGTPVSKAFLVNDIDTSIDNVTVTAVSSNKTLVPDSGIAVTGSGSNKTITITPADYQLGTTTITVTVNDGVASSSSSFLVSVVAGRLDLKSLIPSAGVMAPVFNKNVVYNKLHVPNKTGSTPNNSINIAVTAAYPSDVNVTAYAANGSGVTVSGAYPNFTVNGLEVGTYKLLTIKVADKTSSNYKEYKLDMIRYPGNDADLDAANGLALSSGGSPVALSPVYNNNSTSYSAVVDNQVSTLQVDLLKASLFSTAKLNGVEIGSAGTAGATGSVTLNYGQNLIEIEVTAEDGQTKKTYTINVVRKLSSDASLTDLTASTAGMSPVFNANQSEYVLNVANAVSNVSFTPTAAPGATLAVNGTAHPSGTPWAASLKAGTNTFAIVVTAQDGITQRMYKLVIVRALSDVADLQSLSVSSGGLSPDFSSNVTAYSVEVPNQTASLVMTPVLLDETANLEIDGISSLNGAGYTKNLKVGINTVTIKVTSQSGTREKMTIVSIVRMASSNANLQGLALAGASISPGFDKLQAQYEAIVENPVTEMTITPTAEDSNAGLTLNGNKTNNGQARTVKLEVGRNVFTIVVQAEDGTTSKTYEVTIIRKVSSNADLANLTLSGKSLSAGFDPSTSTYFEYVGNNVTSAAVAAITSDPNATYTVNGVASTGAVPVNLNVGENVITVVSTAADGVTTKEYTVTITRAGSNNANLSDLQISNHDDGTTVGLSPGFAAAIMTYSASVANSVASINVLPMMEDANANTLVRLNGFEITELDGVPLQTGLNVLEFYVVAQDGNMKVYTVNLVRNPGTDATISYLHLSAGALAPDFQPAVTEYSLNVPNEVTSSTLAINTNSVLATYQVLKNGDPQGVSGNTVSLDEGSNIITIEVTAADGITKKTYKITINRAVLPKDASLSSLSVSSYRGSEPIAPVFAAGTYTYSLTVPYEVSEVQLNAVKADALASLTLNGVTFDNPNWVGLAEGANVIGLHVVAQDGKTVQDYSLTITRTPRSHNADLGGMNPSEGALEPVFNPVTTEYTIQLGTDLTSVELNPQLSDTKAVSYMFGRNGASTGNLAYGDNTFDIVVVAEDGMSKTYTVHVVRAMPTPISSNPQGLVATPGDRQVALNWSTVTEATYYSVYMSTVPGLFDGNAIATVTSSTYQVDALTNGTTYYFVVKAGNAGGLGAESNQASATPAAAPEAPTNITATAGDGSATVAFTAPSNNGGSPITGYEVIASPGSIVVTGTSSPITVTGLTNGVSYTFTVIAVNGVSKSAASVASNAVIPVTSSRDSENEDSPVQSTPASSAAQSQDNRGVDVLVNGKAENAGTALNSEVNGRQVTTISVDEAKLQQRLAAAGDKAVITIPVSAGSDVAIGELNGRMVKNMENRQAVVEIRTGQATYTLPAEQINIDAISKHFGTNLSLQDIKVQIEIAVSPSDTVRVVNDAANREGLTVVAPPVDFKVTAVYGGQTEEIKKFNAYVKRTVAIPQGVDPNKITTGVVVEADGTVRHVPTQILVMDGKYYAQINSLTNSTYTLVWHPLEFKDMSNHWAKAAVNNMGSRMVVNGTGNDQFSPDRDITRAEFTAIMIRGLGIKLESDRGAFTDVQASNWYSSAIQSAYAYQLITGFEDGSFRPNENITREQAMLMVSKAMQITKLSRVTPGETADAIFYAFSDGTQVADWARDGVADNVSAGIISGRASDLLAPKAFITRAEVAVMMQRLLQKSNLINE